MRIDSLKQQLQASSGGDFMLAAAALGVNGVEDLLGTHFGGTLVVNNAQPDLDALAVEGVGTVDTLQNRPIRVSFSTDEAQVNVTGLLIALESPEWSVDTSFVKFTGDYLSNYSFTSLAIALSARPEDGTDQAFGVGVGAYVTVADKALFLSAVLPPEERSNNQTSDIILTGTFEGISLGDLDLLAGFVTARPDNGPSFKGLLPQSIPLANNFELRSARFVINPELGFLVLVGIEVRSVKKWVVVEDKFEFDYLDIDFRVSVPGAGSTVYWSVSTEMDIGDAVKVIVGIDSDFYLSGELGDPVPIQPLLNRYLPSANLDFTVDSLRLEGDMSQSPPLWELYLAIATGWTLFDTVAIRAVALEIDAEGFTVIGAQINGTLTLGDASLYLAGVLNQGAGWDFSGRLAHDYNVQLQPNPDFDPSGTSVELFKEETVNNNVSRFFSEVFDSIFPSEKLSGVPSMIDLDIKSLTVEFNTSTKDFHFGAEIDFGDADTTLTFSSLHQQGAQETTFEKRATGVITVFPGQQDEFAFDLGIDLQQGSKHFVAAYSNTSGKQVSLSSLVNALFSDSDADVPEFDITLQDGIVGYVSGETTSQSVFALDMGASINLSSLGDIPLVGAELSAAKTLKLAFQIVYPAVAAGGSISKADLAALNTLIAATGPRLPADSDLTEFFAKAELRLGDGAPIDFNLPVSLDKTSGQLQNDTAKPPLSVPGSQATSDGVNWIQLNKTFGPLSLQRAGFKYDTKTEEVEVLLDGGLAAFGLEVDLMGLSVATKVTGVSHFSPQFGLQGLGVSFSKGGVEVTGVLLHVEAEYDGLAGVQAEKLRLSAIGSLTKIDGNPSLFIYAVLDYPLGGAPAFYVTGLAAGFGLNRKLTLPPVDQVSNFPLITEAIDPPKVPADPGAAGSFISTEMQNLKQYLPASLGEYFGCAGIRFSSFEIVDSFVLVSISFGREFELDVLGLSTLVVPPEAGSTSPALAVISLEIEASFIPDEGIVMVQGLLTKDSYLLDRDCHLSGGFAFGGWFGASPYAGDFVVTLGGYHPSFHTPAHYPSVPRIGVDWKVSSELSVTGGFYFALTPRAIMAGGALRAIFDVDLDLGAASAKVHAWFILGADFIVYWKPFAYSADIYVDMGVDVVIHFLGTHHLSLDAGADLEVWGPPFSGHAHVQLKVIGIKVGFNVSFGSAAKPPPPLEWDDDADASKSFKQSFLPAEDKIVSAAVADGLVRKVDLSNEGNSDLQAAEDVSGDGQVWYILNPTDFSIQTNSVIPTTECDTAIPWADNKTGLADFGSNTDIGIAPMSGTESQVEGSKTELQVDTFHSIVITRGDESAESQFVLRPINHDVPGGLWAKVNSEDVNAASLVEKVPVGFEIVPADSPSANHTQPIDRDLLSYTTQFMGDAWSEGTVDPFAASVQDTGDDPVANAALWARIQTEIHTNPVRDSMLADLGFVESDLDIGESFATDAAYAPQYGTLTSGR